MEKLTCSRANAPTLLEWIRTREGIAVWRTVNLSDPWRSWSAPVIDKQGNRLVRPHSYAASEPERIITSADDVEVQEGREVKRFHIGVERHSLAFKVTTASSDRIRREVDKASEKYQCEAWYEFDYNAQGVIIYVPDFTQTLTEFAKENNL